MASDLSRTDADHAPALDRRDGDHAGGSTLQIRRGAKALVSRDNRVLLLQEEREDGSTFWSLPGGGVDGDESLRDCLRREVTEELSAGVAVREPVTTCTYLHTSLDETVTVYTVFEGELRSDPTPMRSEGIVDHAWVRPRDPPRSTLSPFEQFLAAVAERNAAGDPDGNLTAVLDE